MMNDFFMPIEASIRPHHVELLETYRERLSKSGYSITPEGVTSPSGNNVLAHESDYLSFKEAISKLYSDEITMRKRVYSRDMSYYGNLTAESLVENIRGKRLIYFVLDKQLVPNIDYDKLPEILEKSPRSVSYSVHKLDKNLLNQVTDYILTNKQEILAMDYEGPAYFTDTYEALPDENLETKFINQASKDATVEVLANWLCLPGQALTELTFLPDDYCKVRICGMHCMGNKIYLPINAVRDLHEFKRMLEFFSAQEISYNVLSKDETSGLPYQITLKLQDIRKFAFKK
jgi:REP element-mobilizing transposase RayT